ncbi:MAG: bifunctional diaminohydroxyphosphoribosylaminopyrimidine deaminase/5-amino-6-(5-phosphoribosylamino)uracil reductase RibD [Kordiimonadaceae bacterium]|nr:bifunctional diaminohydroxyphosphoribosylaminopyrimidine deaminase/5-amino-6-(5-phosphoribosylamino)uracil reductase RibD [Kordiimonadaceae bacterium]MBO6570399.1 bifunctional diaminohydroxyphosphoribosylaminopyrimidine deaminase/5-amino-6-(5-phosphoribosylamino)uracil reductase RibD [Kordiimonadaceae bacterium]MBO6965503.1 bifunctional diaminohydroxyphosphoribosylaminopyrimidine deaminase/5-amino-6-(5-phosphoribosylamino)uracil reductase RibD [Kordiimonadaceae bacterium]
MRAALSLARRGLGQVAPNPSVGCVLVNEGIVVGRGWTQPGGRPHAETMALSEAKDRARGAVAYVTLEPCAHTGQTGPCAEALVAAGVARVVVATLDPDPRVSGKGISIIERAGIEVTCGVVKAEADLLNAAFFRRIHLDRTSFTLKTATSLDGRIALANGESQWITGSAARQMGHRLRATHDAILVGSGTVLADNPTLTCRLNGVDGRDPVRLVLDGSGRISNEAKVLKNGIQTITYSSESDVNPHKVTEVANDLASKGINSVLIEGGGRVAASFLKAGLVDCLEVFSAGKFIGRDGISAIHDLGLAKLAGAPHFTLRKIRRLGPDMLASYVKSE